MNKIMIPLGVLPAQVGEQPPALTNQLDQTKLRVVVMFVGQHMLREAIDPLRQQRYLNLGRTGVLLVNRILTDDLRLYFFFQVIFTPELF
jgi:hypothetical protein